MFRANHDRKYALILLAVSAVVLSTGIVLRPVLSQRKKEQKAPPVDLQRLQQLSQQRRLQDLSTYLFNAANNVSSSLVYLAATRSSGVVWGSRDDILAPRRGPVPFALVAAKDSAEVIPAYRAELPPMPGDWVLAVAKDPDGQVIFAHGLYQGQIDAHCGSFSYNEVQSGVPLSSGMVGGGLFTLQGQLLGFVAACDDRPIVISVPSIADFLRKPPSLNDQLQAAYGMRVNGDAGGVQVTAVWDGSAAQSAGLEPGDVIKTVDGLEVHGLEGLLPVAGDKSGEHEIEVVSGRRKLKLHLTASSANSENLAEAGMTLGPGDNGRGVTVNKVSSGTAAARAGILPGDRILRVGNSEVSEPGTVIRSINRAVSHRVILTLQRDGKELEVLLAP